MAGKNLKVVRNRAHADQLTASVAKAVSDPHGLADLTIICGEVGIS